MPMKLKKIFTLIQTLREFFISEGFTDVLTPPLVENPGMETHIHPFAVLSKKDQTHQGYLHTSPEFMMKSLLANTHENFENIFTITHAFRDEPSSPIHRQQFIMLEWYRKNKSYIDIINDSKKLIKHCYKAFNKTPPKIETTTVNELFIKYLHFEILDYLDFNKLAKHIKKSFPHIPLSHDLSSWSWDDLFFILFLNEIEPHLKNKKAMIIKDYPAPLAALSTICPTDPRVCQRFELYINGLEIANCFNELTNLKELQTRFKSQNQEKKKLYNYQLPEPKEFYKVMENYPPSAGIALGVERLLMAIENEENLFLTF